jgi:hypothetical protein
MRKKTINHSKVMYVAVIMAAFIVSLKIFFISLNDFCNAFSMLPTIQWHLVFVVGFFIPSILLLSILKLFIPHTIKLSIGMVSKLVLLYVASFLIFCSLLNTFLKESVDSSIENVIDVTDTSLRKYAKEHGSLPASLEEIKEDQDFHAVIDKIVYTELVYTPAINARLEKIEAGSIELFRRRKPVKTRDSFIRYTEMLIPGCGW